MSKNKQTPSKVQLQLQLIHRHVVLLHIDGGGVVVVAPAADVVVVVVGWFQALGHELEVGLVQDHLGQVLLPLDLLLDGVRHVRDHVGQDELGKVNDVLRQE